MELLSIISTAAPCAVLILGFRSRFTLLWLYAAAGFIVDVVSLWMKAGGLEPYILGNVFVLVELLCISFYYRDYIYANKNIFRALTSVLVIGFITHTIWSGINELNFLGLGILCIVYIGYGIVGYLRIIQSKDILYVTQLPFFWINSAFFLYATSGCILFLFAPFLKTESLQLILVLWANFFVVMNILRYIFIGIGLYKTKQVGT